MAEAGVAAELSTAGLRKPIGELYPAAPLARMLAEAGVPFALSSDAHLPEEVGSEYDRAVRFLAEIGVEEIATFEARERRMEPLG
jgi:histidinol-phosphatase (PHP family)